MKKLQSEPADGFSDTVLHEHVCGTIDLWDRGIGNAHLVHLHGQHLPFTDGRSGLPAFAATASAGCHS